jgi:hypothetical protein
LIRDAQMKPQETCKPVDRTEAFRSRRLTVLNPGCDRAELESRHGKVWNPAELAVEFDVLIFLAPFVVVKRKTDGRQGSLEFQHEPRLYFNWQEDVDR